MKEANIPPWKPRVKTYFFKLPKRSSALGSTKFCRCEEKFWGLHSSYLNLMSKSRITDVKTNLMSWDASPVERISTSLPECQKKLEKERQTSNAIIESQDSRATKKQFLTSSRTRMLTATKVNHIRTCSCKLMFVLVEIRLLSHLIETRAIKNIWILVHIWVRWDGHTCAQTSYTRSQVGSFWECDWFEKFTLESNWEKC